MKKILVVDDEPINVDFFELMLSKLGFEVSSAVDGEDALDKIKASKPDLILLDIIMPKMDGWQLTKILKKDDKFKSIPIIMLTGMSEIRDKVEGFELGIDDYITKPFNFSEVLARVRAVLRNHELFSQIEARAKRLTLAEKIISELQNTNSVKISKDTKEDIKRLEAMKKNEIELPALEKSIKNNLKE
ncbi:MAG: response regulator [Spirochaetaceae bacterium]|nr:response regulator [Spirochaetaceae bacterium]